MASTEAGARAKIAQRGYEAFQTGDMDTLRSLFTSDIAWYSPAQGSGEWHGVDDVMAEFGRLFEDSGGTFRVTVNEVTTGDESVVVLARATATRGDKALDSAYAHIFHFRSGLVSEAWVVNYDQAAFAAFWQ